MSSPEESLVGFSSTELEVVQRRNRLLTSCISELSNQPDSPDKSESRSRSSTRRGSLDFPKNGAKSLRSRSCDVTAIVDEQLKSPTSTHVGEVTSSSIELEAIEEEKNAEVSDNDKAIKNDEEHSDELNIGSQEDGISESLREDQDTKDKANESRDTEDTKQNMDTSDDDLIQQCLEVVPKEDLKTQIVEETNASEKSDDKTSIEGSSASGDEVRSSRETRARVKNQDQDTTPSIRETRNRTSSSARQQLSEDTTKSSSNTSGKDDDTPVRGTRARSRAIATEAQPPSRSTRSNRESTPETTKRLAVDVKKRPETLPRPTRRSVISSPLESIETKSRKQTESASAELPERMSSRRNVETRSATPDCEVRLTRRAVIELTSCVGEKKTEYTTPERRSTRSAVIDANDSIKSSGKVETPGGRETRRSNQEGSTKRTSQDIETGRTTRISELKKMKQETEYSQEIDNNQESDESLSSRRTRSLRSEAQSSEYSRKHELTPSRSPPHKKVKSEDNFSKKTETIKKDGVVITVKKKKKKLVGDKGQVKAFLEADVLRRVQELKSQGLWAEKKLPKQMQEPKMKVHWDFVIEEMNWLSDVVQKELKIKKFNAKKCAAMVQKYFKDKELASIRAEKMREANLRKIAANMAREVKAFWGNAQKLFEWKVKQKLEKKRKEALDQHLQFIVDKTEKYSTLLAESLAETASGQVSRAESVCSGDTEEAPGDAEYAPDSASSDDEETIEKEEIETKDADAHQEELKELEEGAEVPIEELLKKYYPDQLTKMKEEGDVKEEEVKTEPGEGNEEKAEEVVTGRRRRKLVDYAEVEKKIKEEDENKSAEGEEVSVKNEEDQNKENTEQKKDDSLKSLMEGDDKLEEYANMAAKFQPTGNTLETTTVKTKVPSLLKHTLREYQHIGLDWLVSLFERNLNGILADEMGLGKTIQTIALLAHLAVDRSNWGPHLIVVPTSVMLNWEMEIKKWCPGFKVLVYYGSQKERKLKRVGWTKPNAFHICITSYKLVIQDHSSFRRFRWQYFILDEAQHIKNFKSQRWQLLLGFSTVGRLLLTGTPLQNNLMELWSLMHFLMPHVFESHRDFKEWFSNPMTGMVEGNSEYNDSLIRRLHKVLRPFLLRRLKSEVEKQLPKKYEHLVKCPLSKRQRYLYDDFMSRAKTKETLCSGNLLSVINVLMQLRKCCNHPNLFEPRPTLSPYVMDMVDLRLPKLVKNCIDYNVENDIDLRTTSLHLLHHEFHVDPYTEFRASCLATPHSRMMNPPDDTILAKFSCPSDKMRVEVKSQNPPVPKHDFEHHSPVMALTLTGLGYVIPARKISNRDYWLWKQGHKLKTPSGYFQIAKVPTVDPSLTSQIDDEVDPPVWSPPKKIQKMDSSKSELLPTKEEINKDSDSAVDLDSEPRRRIPRHENKKTAKGIFSLSLFSSDKLVLASKSPNKAKKRRLQAKAREAELFSEEYNTKKETYLLNRRQRNYDLNKRRCDFNPLYGSDLVSTVQQISLVPRQMITTRLEQLTCPTLHKYTKNSDCIYVEEVTCYSDSQLVQTQKSSLIRIDPIFDRFIINVPKTWVSNKIRSPISDNDIELPGSHLVTRFQIQTPDTRLIQYDCGKLQVLSVLLRRLFSGGHRALIFTQMTRMLDVLESFLNYHGYVYMRLDGATKVEMRQALMERFNNNSKYFIFILSTRSGGVGINLTGADTVIFYDSDWNPTMDAQAQDRCHRIGQTRDVHIYRLVSERTVEENILKKANQKRILGDLAIEGGNFTTAFFKKQTIHDLFEENATATKDDLVVEENAEAPKKSVGAFENALATAEDDTDRQATKDAKAEENVDEQDFDERTEEDQFNAVLAELSKVEIYALKHVEWMEEDWVQAQLDAAQAEIEARKEEFDAEKLDELTQEIREEMGDVSSEGGDNEESENEDEYSPEQSDSDDEETIEKDEKEVDEKENDNEIGMLENEAEVPIEELIKQYYPDQYKVMELGQDDMGDDVFENANEVSLNDSESCVAEEVDETKQDMEVTENEEFHIEAISEEMMDQVEEEFVAHVSNDIQDLPVNENINNVIVNHDAVMGDEPIVNGGDDVHIEVLSGNNNHVDTNDMQDEHLGETLEFAETNNSYEETDEVESARVIEEISESRIMARPVNESLDMDTTAESVGSENETNDAVVDHNVEGNEAENIEQTQEDNKTDEEKDNVEANETTSDQSDLSLNLSLSES